jgi:hypothetical protein
LNPDEVSPPKYVSPDRNFEKCLGAHTTKLDNSGGKRYRVSLIAAAAKPCRQLDDDGLRVETSRTSSPMRRSARISLQKKA